MLAKSDRAMPWRWLLLGLFAILYFIGLPTHVQGLDTGELVANAFSLTVPHPPGYPLYVWIVNFLMNVIPFGSVFWQASFINMLFVLGALAFLLSFCEGWLGVALVFVLGTVTFVWRYAELPDVFGLHALLTTAILFAALNLPAGPRRVAWVCLLFGLAAANHLTIVFLAPVVIYVLLAERSFSLSLAAAAGGALVAALLYGSLLFLNVDSLFSWGALHSLGDAWHHFLRSDYGTFQLAGASDPTPYSATLGQFVQDAGVVVLLSFLLIGAKLVVDLKSRKQNPALLISLICWLLYVTVFFGLMNLPAGPSHDGIRERFYVFPAFVICLLAISAEKTAVALLGVKVTRVLVAILVLAGLFQVALSLQSNNLKTNSVYEDYARNLIIMASVSGAPTFVLTETDSQGAALKYLLATEPSKSVVSLSTGNLFFRSTLDKIKALWPEFKFDEIKIFEKKNREIFESFVKPNIAKFEFVTPLKYDPPDVETVYLPLGRKYRAGTGMSLGNPDLAKKLTIRAPVTNESRGEFNEEKMLYSDYAIYYLARGKLLYSKDDARGALESFQTGLGLVPYCLPCLTNICALDDRLRLGVDKVKSCRESVVIMKNTEANYF